MTVKQPGRKSRLQQRPGVGLTFAVCLLALFAALLGGCGADERGTHDSAGASATGAAGGLKAVAPAPVNCLGGWARAGRAEQTAYLRGLLDMLELEREWQVDRPLSLKRSLAESWSKAVSGIGVEEMREKLLLYSATYPERADGAVLYALWEIYLRPAPFIK